MYSITIEIDVETIEEATNVRDKIVHLLDNADLPVYVCSTVTEIEEG